MEDVKINSEFIKLDAFMKWAGIASTGVEAKMYILDGEVIVNGEVEERRGKKLYKGDTISFNGQEYKIV